MLKWIKRLSLLLLALLVLVFGTGWWLMRGSLPRLEGDLALAGLSAPVTIQRDARGVVTIDAANETDMARALGYVHAQERYFEMDLMRRTSAGELSGLFGPIALDLDKTRRVHRMRARVNAHLDVFAGDRMPQLQAYTDGVNAGLEALAVRPWPYLVLRQQPRRWEIADSALTGYAMYFDRRSWLPAFRVRRFRLHSRRRARARKRRQKTSPLHRLSRSECDPGALPKRSNRFAARTGTFMHWWCWDIAGWCSSCMRKM